MTLKIFLRYLCGILFPAFIFCSCYQKPDEPEMGEERDYSVVVNPGIMFRHLPMEIRETSGLFHFDDLLWTINDRGNKNILYGFDIQTGKIERRIRIGNASNRDWETLAKDDNFVYIGDVGNNNGNRKDLKILKVPLSSLGPANIDKKAKSEVISFNWSDQKDFLWEFRKTPFDCEAMVSVGDSLVLFTKDWATNNTRAYILPKLPGTYKAELVDTFSAGGLITGADINQEEKVLILSGYRNFRPFLWIFWNFEEKQFFHGRKLRVEYPKFYDAQTEAVLFYGNDTIFVSAERSKRFPQRLYFFRFSEILKSYDIR